MINKFNKFIKSTLLSAAFITTLGVAQNAFAIEETPQKVPDISGYEYIHSSSSKGMVIKLWAFLEFYRYYSY